MGVTCEGMVNIMEDEEEVETLGGKVGCTAVEVRSLDVPHMPVQRFYFQSTESPTPLKNMRSPPAHRTNGYVSRPHS